MDTERARFFDRLKAGLVEGIEHEEGNRTLSVSKIFEPAPPQLYTPDDIFRIRTQLRMSQAVFARLLQVSSKTVQSWEQGVRKPQQSSARLLQFIEQPELLLNIAHEKQGL